MKLRRWKAAVTTAVAVLGLTTLSTSAHAADTAALDYVALGDSYSSGVGAGAYSGGDCRRSANAYPELWKANNAPASFAFTACSGATTSDVLAGQLGPVNSGTDLVSISIGGNDAGFADAMTTCVVLGEGACLDAIADARAYIAGTLPGRLDSVYNAISDRAPNARVVVLGYPHIYKVNGTCSFGISETSRAAINSAADDLHSVTSKRAADHGFAYGDMRPAFEGHEICSGDRWLHSTTWPVWESYHPTAQGQSGAYYPVMESLA
ncbi:SGNH/GDSL hydrolase family protein [Streptomyces sp. DSM 42041]|uniref:SGNH/GDSL hydrolase family protein n=1 Tax=Streptomyces hazeniae TaxID=3075538 RepID=A0ABU2NWP5_9ACTN|nr:SGNH/GDSL hydrolase family protein [Streptomyces sp. DSM 42041]MDT0381154.1 SGNH/GDSL hydrolase family protein [Streptomyces sp. DSM 42041]